MTLEGTSARSVTLPSIRENRVPMDHLGRFRSRTRKRGNIRMRSRRRTSCLRLQAQRPGNDGLGN